MIHRECRRFGCEEDGPRDGCSSLRALPPNTNAFRSPQRGWR
jgi:hypothetical protein